MFLPEAEDPYPVLVIIHESGTSRRQSKSYLAVTRHLLENGIAVLLPDKWRSEKPENLAFVLSMLAAGVTSDEQLPFVDVR